MQKIRPHLWFDTKEEIHEATKLYTTLFPNSKISNISTIHDTPSGDCDIISFELNGQEFMAINAGPIFKFNPSISFFVNFDPSDEEKARKDIDTAWERLSEGGKVLMPLQEYPFSKKYGWIEDKYGVSWQLILSDPNGEKRPFIVPSFLFVKEMCGKAQEAMNFYLSVFKNSKEGTIAKYGSGMAPEKEDNVMYEDFMIENQWFAAMDSGQNHEFAFNESISFIVTCADQEELDYYWNKLSAVPEAEQCGWLKDKYGISWQIVPKQMDEMMSKGTPEQSARVTEAFLKMKKFDIAVLEKAYKGE